MDHDDKCRCAACRNYQASDFQKLLSIVSERAGAIDRLRLAAQTKTSKLEKIHAMAHIAGVSYRAIYRWADRYPEIRKIIDA